MQQWSRDHKARYVNAAICEVLAITIKAGEKDVVNDLDTVWSEPDLS